MFKKIKELEIYKKYKELRANPQSKALISLMVWGILFVVLILFTRGINNNVSNHEYKTNNNLKLINYEYTYMNDKYTIFGEKYNDKEKFSIMNNKYYYNGKDVYLVNGNLLELMPNFDLNILKINIDMIDNLTSNLSYTENEGIFQYLVPLVNFINLYDSDTAVDLSVANNYNIIILKYYKDDDLYKVEIDLSNYYKINNMDDCGKLNIYLYNKNKLSDFSLEYDKMLGVR